MTNADSIRTNRDSTIQAIEAVAAALAVPVTAIHFSLTEPNH